MAKLFSAARPDRLEVIQNTTGPSLTRQEFAQEADINVLMAKYEQNGIFPNLPGVQEPKYLDCTSVPTDFRSAMDFLLEAEASFMQLHANIRREFENDPVRFVEFATNPANLAKMKEWGLCEPDKVDPPPMRVEVVNPPAAVQTGSGGPGSAS